MLSYEKFHNTKIDICVFLTCTNFFRKISWVKDVVNNLIKNKNLESSFLLYLSCIGIFWHQIKGSKPEKIAKWMRDYTSRQIALQNYIEKKQGLLAQQEQNYGERVSVLEKKLNLLFQIIHLQDLI